jgi:hypothetical protein
MSAIPVPISAVDPLVEAVETLISAKRAEEAAKSHRLEAEARILALLPPKEEGSQTVGVGGYKVTLTGKLAYKCDDPRALSEFCASAGWSPSLVPVKARLDLDETGCKWLRANDPQAWATLARFVTITPQKTSLTVKAA